MGVNGVSCVSLTTIGVTFVIGKEQILTPY